MDSQIQNPNDKLKATESHITLQVIMETVYELKSTYTFEYVNYVMVFNF